MSTIRIQRAMPAPVAFEAFARNGRTPPVAAPLFAGASLNYALVQLRKVVFTKGLNFGSLPISSASSLVGWPFRFRSGRASPTAGQLQLRFHMGVVPDSRFTDANPTCVWTVDDGGTPVDSTTLAFARSTSDAPGYDDIHVGTQYVNIDPETEYSVILTSNDGCRPVMAVAYEAHVPYVDTADPDVVDTRLFHDGAHVTAAQQANVLDVGHALWQDNAQHLLSWCVDDLGDTVYRTTTSTSFVNLLDGSVTAVGANSPGVRVQTRHHGARHAPDAVPVKLCVYGQYGAGVGAGGEVRLVDASGAIVTINSFTVAGLTWFTGTGVLDGTVDTQKLDIQFRTTNAADAMRVQAVALFEYAP